MRKAQSNPVIPQWVIKVGFQRLRAVREFSWQWFKYALITRLIREACVNAFLQHCFICFRIASEDEMEEDSAEGGNPLLVPLEDKEEREQHRMNLWFGKVSNFAQECNA